MIESQANPHVKHIRSLAADRKDRRRERLFVLEGVRLVADALAGGAVLDLALYAPDQLELTEAGQALLDRLEALAVAHPASAQGVAAASDTVHPQGVVALARSGVALERQFFETEAQWMTGPDQAMRSLLDIPVGMTIAADQVEVNFMLDGAVHVLQVGPQSAGHCYSDPTTIHGAGTSRGTIRREAENRWVVDVPAGSIARLFDRHLGDPNAISRGRYYVSLHYTVIH